MITLLAGPVGFGPRAFSTLPVESTQVKIQPNFLSHSRAESVKLRSIELQKAISTRQGSAVLSRRRDLKNEEHCLLVSLLDKKSKNICGLHPLYRKNNGHRPTYFLGRRNIPGFLKVAFIAKLLKFLNPNLKTKPKLTEWNFTFDFRLSSIDTKPFSINLLDSFGDTVFIYNLSGLKNLRIQTLQSPTLLLFPENSLLTLNPKGIDQCAFELAQSSSPTGKITNFQTLGKVLETSLLIFGHKRLQFPNAGESFHHLYPALAHQARNLIFGERSYQEFTDEEQMIVDEYQSLILLEDGDTILPNTGSHLEMLRSRMFPFI